MLCLNMQLLIFYKIRLSISKNNHNFRGKQKGMEMELKELFDNSTVRRRDRLLDYDRAEELLAEAEYGVLSLGGESGYGIPMNYALKGASLYFHCAPQGEKLQRVEQNHQACFCVIGNTEVQPSTFSTIYESVLAFGPIHLVEDDEERMAALGLFVNKYSPDFKEIGRKYAEKALHKTAILRLDIARMTGKRK